ncbi:MAG: hypothetical protein L0241_13025 [Planctomycetia bacterium]|nr:hypothetical protein [Planctomycetia bacterium]
MTHSPAEVELSPEASARLDDYLRQVRAALAGAADVNPDEIEADIREHVENELHDAPRPVSLSALEAVLTRLGPPSQWGATGDPGVINRVKHLLRERLRGARVTVVDKLRIAREALWSGPEDWRLAYLSFGVFALGVLTVFVFPLALLVSYILSRAGLAVAKEKGIELGARKWLLYPSVVLVSLALLIALVAWPVALGGWVGGEVESATNRVQFHEGTDPVPAVGSDWRELRNWQDRQKMKERLASQVEDDRKLLAMVPVAPEWAPVAAGLFVGAGALVLWWTILGFVSASFPQTVRAVFTPFCDRFERRHGLWIAGPCLALSVAWCAVAFDVVSAAGLI